MNRVYKVIWSKAKHCYVVTSEIAKGYGKSAGSKGVKALLSGLVALSIAMGGYGLAGAVFVESKAEKDSAVYTQEEVYTKSETDAELAKKADKATTLAGYGITDAYTNAEVNGKITAEETARKAADQGNLKVGAYDEILKVKEDSTEVVNKLVLNKDGNNPITMDENGIKVGKNSTVIASEGVFAGGDTADAAKAALNANGSIKGANGKFTVDTNGLVTANGGVDTNSGDILTRGGKINAGSGDISGKDISASGDISGKDITGSGTVKGHAVTDGTARMEGGALTGVTTITAGGDVVSTGGKVQGTSVSDGTATLSGGSLNNAVDINASGTITGNNVVVKGKLTTNGLETDRITLGSETLNQTDINKGNVTSKVNDTVGAVEYTAESIFNKDGSSITARTDEGNVDSTGKSIVGAKEISQYLGNNAVPDSSDKNVTRNMVRNGDGTFSMEDKAVDGTKSSTVSQNAGERKVTVTDGTKTLNVTENLTGGIVSETDDGAGNKVTLTQGMDGTYIVETSGTSTEDIGGQKIENYKGGLDTNINGEETHDVSGTMTTTVEGKATENFNGGLATEITGDETHDVSGTMTTTVEGKATENFN
ncbi:ESPR-type extended signal peptide-containing protein, partial [uncultured Dialister sp.]|uniref:ESPR-type extended signal peptide-containing protein n=1 Tax=uncultured Dialister sp. TaxID=278064 RepID=UPI002670854D